jgi:tRNA-dihydrouridine synthase A
MLTIKEVLQDKSGSVLEIHPLEPPVAIQLGGSHPAQLAECARLAQQAGYSEVNLNVGCPSQRVACGGIGASLMLQPELVAECVAAMQQAVTIPVTVKCRLGVDDHDTYELLHRFISLVSHSGCQKFIIHARKAWLSGLNPKQNREIPPLDYERVYRLKADFPDLVIIINGGIVDLRQVTSHLDRVDGVMIGRAAYDNPFLLATVDQQFYQQAPRNIEPQDVVQHYIGYARNELTRGTRLSAMTRHLLNVFQGMPGARNWRRHLSTCSKEEAGVDMILAALMQMQLIY